MKKQLLDKNLNNNKTLRRISDKFDEFFGWQDGYRQDSIIRGYIHGCYHGVWGIMKFFVFNKEGSYNEFKRARDQFLRKGRDRL